MTEGDSSSASATPEELRVLVRLSYLRKASAWAAVVWFPAALIFVAVDGAGWALGILVSGAVFSGALRVIVATSRCPRCREMYSSAADGLREIWQQERCNGCGLRRFDH